jgi:hypothetical protein
MLVDDEVDSEDEVVYSLATEKVSLFVVVVSIPESCPKTPVAIRPR